MRIAVLDDDSAQAGLICQTLDAAGHTCHVFTSAEDLLRQWRSHALDLLLLDWNAPALAAGEVLREVRDSLSRRLPVLFMTHRGREIHLASIVDASVEDYVIKPVAAQALLERVEALLQRAYRLEPPATSAVFGEFEFDLRAKLLSVRGAPVAVTLKEFDLALLLFQHLGRPISRAHILSTVWKQSVGIPSRTMDTHISVLRTKLGLRPDHGYRLTPIYGYGYLFERLDVPLLPDGGARLDVQTAQPGPHVSPR